MGQAAAHSPQLVHTSVLILASVPFTIMALTGHTFEHTRCMQPMVQFFPDHGSLSLLEHVTEYSLFLGTISIIFLGHASIHFPCLALCLYNLGKAVFHNYCIKAHAFTQLPRQHSQRNMPKVRKKTGCRSADPLFPYNQTLPYTSHKCPHT